MRRRGSERYLPIAYFAVAGLIVGLLLPTALRPPQDEQTQSAAFSPDAPPDDTPQETLLQSLRRASSATAGTGETEVEVVEAKEQELAAPPPEIQKPSKGFCFGNPPRQTESLYSAPCVPAWTGGDNGGATAPGITEDEIKIGFNVGVNSSAPEGRLSREFTGTETPSEWDAKVWQTYFNLKYEFHGRYLQFYIYKESATNEDVARAAVEGVKENYDVFALVGSTAAGTVHAMRLGLVVFEVQAPCEFFNDNHPYVYSFYMDTCSSRRFTIEMICKNFAHRPPGLINKKQDLTFNYEEERIFGLVVYQDDTRFGAVDFYRKWFDKECGVPLPPERVQEFNLTDNSSSIQGAVTKMRTAGVTTIIMATDALTPLAFSYEAHNQGYFPEWIGAAGTGMQDTNGGENMKDEQAANLVGMSTGEIERPDEDTDWFRAYKEIDPEGEPEFNNFRDLQVLSNGLQMAKTNITPETFWQGLLQVPYREPDPVWSVGGGYRQVHPVLGMGDFTMADYASLMWWYPDPEESTDDEDRWCWMYAGRRFLHGEVPGEDDNVPWFDRSQCIIRPEYGVQG